MKILRMVLFAIGVALMVVGIANFVRIEAQPDLTPDARASARLWFTVFPSLFASLAFSIQLLLPLLGDWFQSRAATPPKKPVTFSINDPARGVVLSCTLTETEKSADDTEGRKKIGAVLEYYGSGGNV